jgi:hypothetical protein
MANYGQRWSAPDNRGWPPSFLVAVAVGAHIVWILLAPILPSLLGIFLVAILAYVLLGLRR